MNAAAAAGFSGLAAALGAWGRRLPSAPHQAPRQAPLPPGVPGSPRRARRATGGSAVQRVPRVPLCHLVAGPAVGGVKEQLVLEKAG